MLVYIIIYYSIICIYTIYESHLAFCLQYVIKWKTCIQMFFILASVSKHESSSSCCGPVPPFLQKQAGLWSGCQAAVVSPDGAPWWCRRAATPAPPSLRAVAETRPESWGQTAHRGQRSKAFPPAVLWAGLATRRASWFARRPDSGPDPRISEERGPEIRRSAKCRSEKKQRTNEWDGSLYFANDISLQLSTERGIYHKFACTLNYWSKFNTTSRPSLYERCSVGLWRHLLVRLQIATSWNSRVLKVAIRFLRAALVKEKRDNSGRPPSLSSSLAYYQCSSHEGGGG